MVPPLRGGTRGGGLWLIGGGMARDAFATLETLICKPNNRSMVSLVA